MKNLLAFYNMYFIVFASKNMFIDFIKNSEDILNNIYKEEGMNMKFIN